MRIGITMRVVEAEGYKEPRDALAHDWHNFMKFAFPECTWVPLTNIGKDITSSIEELQLKGVILSGGNDIGSCPRRDETELAIVDYAMNHELPIFGVCRGLQLLQTYFKGELQPCSKDQHVATRHNIVFSDEVVKDLACAPDLTVNSYHNFGVKESMLSKELISFAQTDDGWVEGLKVVNRAVMAVMWHPEREQPYNQIDQNLMRQCFGLTRSVLT